MIALYSRTSSQWVLGMQRSFPGRIPFALAQGRYRGILLLICESAGLKPHTLGDKSDFVSATSTVAISSSCEFHPVDSQLAKTTPLIRTLYSKQTPTPLPAPPTTPTPKQSRKQRDTATKDSKLLVGPSPFPSGTPRLRVGVGF